MGYQVFDRKTADFECEHEGHMKWVHSDIVGDIYIYTYSGDRNISGN